MTGWNIDSNVENADWPKFGTWDFYGSTKHQADEVLSGHGSPQENFDGFMRLPVANAMPNFVRRELRKRGYDVPDKPRKGGK